MSFNSSIDLGRALGSLSQKEDNLKENISPNEEDALFNVFNTDSINLSGHVIISKYLYATNQFILDHPTNSKLDDTKLVLDAGYVSSQLVGTIYF